MMRKILVMSMICLCLSISLPTLSAINEGEKEISSLTVSEFKIVSPREGTRHFGMVLLRCKAPSDIDYVKYSINADWEGDGNVHVHGPWNKGFKKPLYTKLWIGPHFPLKTGCQKITIWADGHQYDYDENGEICGSHFVARSPQITIYRRF
jgi:hypothetical protein